MDRVSSLDVAQYYGAKEQSRQTELWVIQQIKQAKLELQDVQDQIRTFREKEIWLFDLRN